MLKGKSRQDHPETTERQQVVNSLASNLQQPERLEREIKQMECHHLKSPPSEEAREAKHQGPLKPIRCRGAAFFTRCRSLK